MSAWWSLPRAAPVLLRHLMAYAEMAEQDIADYSSRLMAKLVAAAVAIIAGLFTLALICIAVVAAAWDTPHRMLAIYWMLGGFGALTLIAGVIASNRGSADSSLFESVQREWREDRVILERILAAEDHEAVK